MNADAHLQTKYANELAPDGLIPAKLAKIIWRSNRRNEVVDARVLFHPSRATPQEYVAADDETRFISSAGVITEGWMLGEPDRTPEGVFADWLERGFGDGKAMRRALSEMGKISECEWARTMAAALKAMDSYREPPERDV